MAASIYTSYLLAFMITPLGVGVAGETGSEPTFRGFGVGDVNESPGSAMYQLCDCGPAAMPL